MSRSPFLRIGWLGAAGLLALALAAYFWRALFTRAMFFLGDITYFYYPVFAYATRALREGTLPLWCPELEGGMPFLGFWEGTFLYPVDIAFRLFGETWIGFNASILFHYLLAGLGMLAYSRSLGFAPLPGLLAALAFTLNGFMVLHLEHVNMVVAAAWMPWLFLAVERLWERPRVVTGALAGGIVALQLLGGHPDVFLMSTFAVGLYALLHPARGLLFQRDGRRLLAPLAALLGVYVLGILLAAGQLLPTLTLAASSWSHAQERITAQSAASLLNDEYWHLLLPDLRGRAGDDTHFGPRGYWERCGYAGTLTLALALVGLAGRHRMRAFWLTGILLGLFFAMGPRSPLFSLLREVPGFGTTRLPSRWLFLFDFGIALLAGAGLQVLVTAPASPSARTRLRWAAAGLLAASLIVGLFLGARLWPGGTWMRSVHQEIPRFHGQHPFDASAWLAAYQRRLSGGAMGVGLLLLLGNGMLWSRLRSAAPLPWLAPVGVAALYLDLFHFGADYNPVFPDAEIAAEPRTARFIRESSARGDLERLAHAHPHPFQVFTLEHRGFWPDYSDADDRRKFLEMLPGNWHLLAPHPAYGQNDTALRLLHWRQLRAALYTRSRTLDDRLQRQSRLWPYHNVGYVVSWHPLSLPGLAPLTVERPYLYRVLRNEGRAFFRPEAVEVPSDRDLYPLLVTNPELLADRVLLSTPHGAAARPARRERGRERRSEGARVRLHTPITAAGISPRDNATKSPRSLAPSPPPPLPPSAVVQVLRDSRHEVELEVRAPRPGYVVLTDTYYPGWRATLNGRPAPIRRANGVHRAVATPAGAHRLLFSYEAAAPRLGFFVSLLMLAAAVAASTFSGVRAFGRRGPRNTQKDAKSSLTGCTGWAGWRAGLMGDGCRSVCPSINHHPSSLLSILPILCILLKSFSRPFACFAGHVARTPERMNT